MCTGLWLVLPASALAQEDAPTPTATPTPAGPAVFAYEQVNVRAGPGTDSELVGVLVVGQRARIVGRSPAGAWLQIEYVGGPGNLGWVYGDLVRLEGVADREQLPTVEAPPTPTLAPPATPIPGVITDAPDAERLPTFTPAPPPVIPTLLPADGVDSAPTGLPPIFIITGLFVTGLFGLIISLLRQSR